MEQSPPLENTAANSTAKLFEQVIGDYKKYIEFIPPDRNFTVLAQETEPGTKQIVLVSLQGGTRSLNEYLPDKVSFVEGNRFEFRTIRKQITYNPEQLQYRGSVLTALHEIGHAHEKNIPLRRRLPKDLLAGVQQNIKSLLSVRPKISRASLGERGSIPVLKISGLAPEETLPEWYLDYYTDDSVASERNAWAYALKKAKGLQQDGYDVFAGFSSRDEVLEFINLHLYTHELVRTFKAQQINKDPNYSLSKFTKREPLPEGFKYPAEEIENLTS